MNAKRIIIAGTIAVAITVSGGLMPTKSSASPEDKSGTLKPGSISVPAQRETAERGDSFLATLGVSSDEKVYDALYNGESLADIAAANNRDVQSIIDLQIAEMTQQLDERLAMSSLTQEQYEAQKAELSAIITSSVYGQKQPAEIA